MKRISVLAATLVAAALTACGSTSSPTQPAATLTANITVGGATNNTYDWGTADYFLPSSVRIKSGGTVTWTQASDPQVNHNVTFTDATDGVPTNISNWKTGSNSRTFSTVGDFHFRCTNHYGMGGTVSVVAN